MEKTCPNCQRQNPPDAAFCRHCASPLISGSQTPFTNEQQNQQQNRQQNQQWNQPQGGTFGQSDFAGAANAGASGRAIASVALAIGGLLLCCFLAGIPAAILGWLEINAIKEGRSSPKGLMMAQIGLWGGIAVTILSAIFSGLWMFMAMLGGGGGYYG